MKILLDDYNAKVGQEDIFKPTIGKGSLYKISNDNGFRLVSFTHQKISFSKVQCFHTGIYIHKLGLLHMG